MPAASATRSAAPERARAAKSRSSRKAAATVRSRVHSGEENPHTRSPAQTFYSHRPRTASEALFFTFLNNIKSLYLTILHSFPLDGTTLLRYILRTHSSSSSRIGVPP